MDDGTAAIAKRSGRARRRRPALLAGLAAGLVLLLLTATEQADAARSPWRRRPGGAQPAAPTTTTTARPPRTTLPPTTAPPTTAPPTTASPTTTAGGPSGTCPSGVCAPTTDAPGWRRVFVDDFTTDVPTGQFPAAVESRWGAYADGWTDTSGKGTYMPSKVLSVHGGVLDWFIRTEGGRHLVSAPWPKVPGGTGPKGGHLTGRYEIRFRADRMPGYKFVSLLWPDRDDNLRDGEIDFPEGDLDEPFMAFTHHAGASSGDDQDWFATGADATTWHTAVIERTAGSVTYFLDGKQIGRSTNRLPVGEMGWVLQAETSLANPTGAAAQGHLYVDWVAVSLPR
jgi:hypothetical protein